MSKPKRILIVDVESGVNDFITKPVGKIGHLDSIIFKPGKHIPNS